MDVKRRGSGSVSEYILDTFHLTDCPFEISNTNSICYKTNTHIAAIIPLILPLPKYFSLKRSESNIVAGCWPEATKNLDRGMETRGD